MPTIRQRIAVQKLSEILRNAKKQKHITMQKILKEAGYSDWQAIASTQVIESKGFKQLFDELVTDQKMAEKHDTLMSAVEIDIYKMDAKLSDKEIAEIVESIKGFKIRKIIRTKGEPMVTVYFYRPDNMAIDRALDKSYKIKGYYSAEKHEVGGSIDVVEINNYGSNKK